METSQHISYQEAWSFLDKLQFFKIKLGLDSMTAFMESLENPQRQFPCIHVGGTNGKGSVGSTLLSILTEAGYKVGFYTSPHLSSVRERFRIADEYISKDEFALQAEKIINILNGRQITYFEFTTALAFLWFAARKVDTVILEVGLGGRLDATNIITPLVSVITNVSMDHELYLGNTIAKVASEKAGIIKHGVPVVTGTTDTIAREIIGEAGAKNNSPVYMIGRDFVGTRREGERARWSYRGIRTADHADPSLLDDLPLNMKGEYQVTNASVALAALEVIKQQFPVSRKQIDKGLQKVLWPGRLEEFWWERSGKMHRKPEGNDPLSFHFLLDGAHNPDGAKALKKSLEEDFLFDRLILVWASMADKEIRPTLLEIAPKAEVIIFTKPDEERSADPGDLKVLLPEKLQQKTYCIDPVSQALDHALANYTPGTMICVAGSLYLVGRARQILCGELVDSK